MATSPNPTRDDFAALLNDALGGTDAGFEGRVVKGTITAIENDLAVIDVDDAGRGGRTAGSGSSRGRHPCRSGGARRRPPGAADLGGRATSMELRRRRCRLSGRGAAMRARPDGVGVAGAALLAVSLAG